MTNTAKQVKALFAFQQGNWRATRETTIQETKIYEGESISISLLKIGGHWQGDQFFFADGSWLAFPDLEIGGGRC